MPLLSYSQIVQYLLVKWKFQRFLEFLVNFEFSANRELANIPIASALPTR